MSTLAPIRITLPKSQWTHLLALLSVTLAVLLAIMIGTPFLPLLLMIGLGAFAFTVLRVDAFLYAVVFFLPIPLRLPKEFPLHDATAIVRAAMLLGVCVRFFGEGRSLRSLFLGARLSYLTLAYGLISVLSAVLFNQRTILGMGAAIWLFSYLCFYFTIIGWIRTEQQMKTIISLLLLSTTIVALFGLYQSAIGGYGDLYSWLYPTQSKDVAFWTGRITSFFNYYTCLAGYLNLVLPFALACSLIQVGARLRFLAILCFITATAALLLTETRGAVLAFAGTLLLGAILLPRKLKSRRVLVVLILVTILGSGSLLGHLSPRYSSIEDDSGVMRFVFWDAAWGMFASSPLIGAGYGNFGGLYELAGEEIRRDVHNIYLQLLAETGVTGFAIFFLLLFISLRAAWRISCCPRDLTERVLGFAALGAILTVLTHGLVDYLFNASPQFGALFWMILALLVANGQLRAKRACAMSPELA